VRPVGGAVVLAGTSPRAALAAAYALLAAAGCRWSPDGAGEEHVPSGAGVRRRVRSRELGPAFARRVYAADLATWHYAVPARLAERLPADVAFVDWMAKSGATGLLFIRHAHDTQWVVPELVPALRERGLEIEGGGHALAELLPRDLFAAHPEYFPLGTDGRRTDLGNVCVSSGPALALLAARARAARDGIPGATGLHLWGLDLLGGGWCRCSGCARLTPSEQALTVCNRTAAILGGGARVHHLAYHDTLRPPRAVRPHPRVWAEFAPRERCYAHALADPTCPRNRRYREALEQHLELFAGRVDVFEYYGDAILFGGCAVPLTRVIARDLEYYARAGVRGVSCLTFGRYTLRAYGVNVEAFARGSVRPADAARARAAHCTRRYGRAADAMRRYLIALERLMSPLVTYGDVWLPPLAPDRAAAVHESLGRSLRRGAAVRALLRAAAGCADRRSRPRIGADTRLLDLTLATLAAVRGWLAARLAGDHAAPAAERAAAALEGARAHLSGITPAVAGTWGAYDLPVTHAFFAEAWRVAAAGGDPLA
jgi:hypothetical protein